MQANSQAPKKPGPPWRGVLCGIATAVIGALGAYYDEGLLAIPASVTAYVCGSQRTAAKWQARMGPRG